MIYKSLDLIPYKLFIEIEKTENFKLLCTANEKIDEAELQEIWNELYDEHLSRSQTTESKKIFKLSKLIDEMLATNMVVTTSCDILLFDFNEDVYQILIEKGFKISTESSEKYQSDLSKIKREASAYIVKAQFYKSMLPDKKELSVDGDQQNYTIDDLIASYSAILGYNIGDSNTITYNAFKGNERQVNAKCDALIKQNKDGK